MELYSKIILAVLVERFFPGTWAANLIFQGYHISVSISFDRRIF